MRKLKLKTLNRLLIGAGIIYIFGSLILGRFMYDTVYFAPYSLLYFISMIHIVSHIKITNRLIAKIDQLKEKKKDRH